MPEKTVEELQKELETIQNQMKDMFDRDYVSGLRSEAANYRTKLREKEAEIDTYKDSINKELEEYNKWKSDAAARERERLLKEGKFDEIEQMYKNQINDLTSKSQSKITELENLIKTEKAKHDGVILRNELLAQAAKAKAHNPDIIVRLLSDEAKVVHADNGTSIKILNPDGTERMDSNMKPYTIEQRLQDMKNDANYAMLFAGGKPGGGSNTINTADGMVSIGGKMVHNPFDKEHINFTLQDQLFGENKELASRLEAEAKNK